MITWQCTLLGALESAWHLLRLVSHTGLPLGFLEDMALRLWCAIAAPCIVYRNALLLSSLSADRMQSDLLLVSASAP